ncbi:helix-turn-helix transcriptional regulator [Fibrella forsythiae]|uniref:Helix-turn-helix transcriptional regulator n=1 Tax=Fibrella forsythiae TaxID=2817061 RepID=A0ABS3JSZ5_9BACT|nr:helix-turn-helix transcriptional regulator [Fibrella forsythiae]MBO0953122.1 helix-turn-helix transcriptional regulator [Fibrella forsythiae]
MLEPQQDIKQQVANLIREARKAKGLTQEELGERLGVTKAAINSYETGKQNLTVVTLQKLSIALGESLQISIGK